jgi:hypothetical protein
LPGAIGRSGCLRSSACTPVIASVRTVRSPCAARCGACWELVQIACTC